MMLTVSGVTNGQHVAKFLGVKSANSRFGPGLLWMFQVGNDRVNAMTNADPAPHTKCGKMLAAIVGGALTVGQQVNIEQYVGRTYRVTVESWSRGSKVVGVCPV